MKKSVMVISIVAGLLLSGNSQSVAKEGLYIGFDLVHQSIDDDFDGDSAYTNGPEIIIVPDIESDEGFGLHIGYQLPSKFAIELGFIFTEHDSTWLGNDFDVDHGEIYVDFKYYLNMESPIRPYLRAGLGFHVLEVDDGATDGVLTTDAEYRGAGINMGAGLDYFFNNNISVGLAAIYKFVEYDEAEGLTDEEELDDELDGSGLTASIRLSYHF